MNPLAASRSMPSWAASSDQADSRTDAGPAAEPRERPRRATLGCLEELDATALLTVEARWLGAVGRSSVTTPQRAPFVNVLQGLQAELQQIEDGLRQSAPAEVDALADMALAVCEEGVPAARAAHPQGPAREVLELMVLHLPAASGGATPRDRSMALLSLLTRLLRVVNGTGTAVAQNRFESDAARWAANLTNASIHTGLIVAVTTTLRQLLGFALERAMTIGELSDTARHAIGASCLLIGPALNIAGLMRDECQNRATAASRLARVSMLLLSACGLCVAALVGHPPVMASRMSSFGLQMLSYCIARETAQLFFPLTGNSPVRLGGTVIGAGAYGVGQTVTGMGMDAWAPRSGAGWVMAEAARAPRGTSPLDSAAHWFIQAADGASGLASTPSRLGDQVRAAVQRMAPHLPHDLLRGGLNAGGEVLDVLFMPIATHLLAQREQRQRAAVDVACGRAPRPRVEPLRLTLRARWPDRNTVTDQCLLGLAQRTSAFETIMAGALAVDSALQGTGLSAGHQSLIVNATVGALAASIYLPFVYTYRREAPPSLAPWLHRPEGAELRHRWPGGEPEAVVRREDAGPAKAPERPTSSRENP
ncbi:hypothetical protein [Roseateles amylovorans]|uniref:Uncharacterized protein n=1 Tax=Roseateles amylovorans TaxID=2978473 RepID=A0ABY6B609_9BURK|nr:hypothetical protein [Roseateles amylovorans]UXH79763.1 hypothetical protein N4261_07680 [Roseateles amylovorans]